MGWLETQRCTLVLCSQASSYAAAGSTFFILVGGLGSPCPEVPIICMQAFAYLSAFVFLFKISYLYHLIPYTSCKSAQLIHPIVFVFKLALHICICYCILIFTVGGLGGPRAKMPFSCLHASNGPSFMPTAHHRANALGYQGFFV